MRALDVWTEERVAQLTKLWASGLSCSQIAEAMGCFAHCGDRGRSAVIGKIHRLGLPQPEGKRKPKPLRPREPRPPRVNLGRGRIMSLLPGGPIAPRRKREAPPAQTPDLHEALKSEAPDGTGVKLRELTEFNCHWPKGDPHEPDFEFCGAPALHDLPYCAHHCRIAYQETRTRTRVDKALQHEGSQHGKTRTTEEEPA
ncbi:GcrA family cell cycle regulator [Bradyrhizobium lablabi]|uniref:GcrA family cell cycle regulator n=1 Tax=Bradyrhizobium lablabi TaxID=722472 RepID=UPI001BABD492|nr:GcrA family cell cycle regulator [Bradyrhizobium lablabi]MBR0693618.1 GcrA cell cycle regulator [Bradyrhizobium lablabi]